MPRRRRSSRPVTATTDEATNPTLGGAAARGERKAFSASALEQPEAILRKDHRLSRYSPEEVFFYHRRPLRTGQAPSLPSLGNLGHYSACSKWQNGEYQVRHVNEKKMGIYSSSVHAAPPPFRSPKTMYIPQSQQIPLLSSPRPQRPVPEVEALDRRSTEAAAPRLQVLARWLH